MSKKKEPIIDYMALSKTMVLFSAIAIVMLLSVYMPLHSEAPECDSCDGIVVDKYAVHEKKLGGQTYSYYYLVVDCNGTNRTKMMLSEDLLKWKYTEIGDIEHVCWLVE